MKRLIVGGIAALAIGLSRSACGSGPSLLSRACVSRVRLGHPLLRRL